MTLVRLVVIAYIGYALLLFLVQRSVIYPGVTPSPPRPSSAAPDGVTQVWLDASFGRVEAWLFETGDSTPGPALLFAHGNAELIDHGRADMDALRALGLTVLAVEYPGYGQSDGRPTRASIAETFTLAYDWLAARPEVDAERIVLMGRSLGSGAVGDLALVRPVRALVLQAPFSSFARMAWEVFKVPGLLVRDRFDNERVARRFGGPILLVHGTLDEVVPYTHSVRLKALRDDIELMSLDCAHNDYWRHWPAIVERIRGFLVASGVL